MQTIIRRNQRRRCHSWDHRQVRSKRGTAGVASSPVGEVLHSLWLGIASSPVGLTAAVSLALVGVVHVREMPAEVATP